MINVAREKRGFDMSLKELDLLNAADKYCNFNPSEGGEDKAQLMTVAKNFTKDEIESTIDFIGSTVHQDDERIKTTLQKLYSARK